MVRFSVSLNEEQNNWVEEMAENLNGSKTQVIQMLVEDAMEESPPSRRLPTGDYSRDRDGRESDSNSDTQQLKQQISTLEHHLADLEATLMQTLDESQSAGSRYRSRPEAETVYNYSINDFIEVEHTEDVDGEATESIDTALVEQHFGVLDEEEKGDSADVPISQNEDSESHPVTDIDSIREYIEQHNTTVASPEEILSCWELLRERGTGGPQAFKMYCYSQENSTEEERERWWREGVYPVLTNLPGVQQHEENNYLLQFQY